VPIDDPEMLHDCPEFRADVMDELGISKKEYRRLVSRSESAGRAETHDGEGVLIFLVAWVVFLCVSGLLWD